MVYARKAAHHEFNHMEKTPVDDQGLGSVVANVFFLTVTFFVCHVSIAPPYR